ncbi:hypothetical protein RHSIM_Rhsim12G0213300 [Rhododendron simsii]|uniref:RING-type E3 ubiquitin transferase n=1 Tax=Rhododendron simsii TaxID=118357 RepID=A0A834L8T0_RHOSS|nr:hypothetical protein RHSIM_Rhsim12G0213300 [Rhododendron simsii]
MGDSFYANDSAAIAVTGKIMVVAIVILFLVVAFVLFLHLYAKWFWHRRQEAATTTTATTTRRRRLDFVPGAGTAVRSGLDPTLLKSLPILIFNHQEFKDGLECAVCLSEVSDGEKARLLPKCNHGFHLDCIDLWFQSHSTCPLCRNPVSTQPESQPRVENSAATAAGPVGVYSTDSPNFPTNVLFWGNQTRVSTLGACLEEGHTTTNAAAATVTTTTSHLPSSSSSSSSSLSTSTSSINRPDGCLVIDIPRQIVDEEEETKSPVTTRLRSLKRLLSRDRRVNPFSPRVDTEQQMGRGQS